MSTDKLPVAPHFILLGEQKIALFDSGGTGRAIVLIHGNSSSSAVWSRVFNSGPGMQFRLIAIDLPGHGESSPASPTARERTYSIPGYADVIGAVTTALSLVRPVYVGWSLGGHALLEASPKLPDAAGFLIFGTPPLTYPPAPDFGGAFLKLGLGFVKDWTMEQAREYVSEFFAPEASGIPEFFLHDALATDGYARSSLAGGIATVGYSDELRLVAELRQPLAILQGAREQIVNGAYLESLVPAIPQLWRHGIQYVTGAGHAIAWEDVDGFSQLLSEFVAYCDA